MFPSDEETDRALIRNEETLRRRDWIACALAAVRGRLTADEPDADRVDPPEASAATGVLAAASPDLPSPVGSRKPVRPRLYVVRSTGHR